MRKHGTAAHGGRTSFAGSVAGLSLCVMRAVRFSCAHRRNQVALAAYARSHRNALLNGTRTHCAPTRLCSSQPRWLQRPCAGGLARTRTLTSSSHTHALTHTHIGLAARSADGFSAFEAAALTLIKSVQVSAHLMPIADSLPSSCLPTPHTHACTCAHTCATTTSFTTCRSAVSAACVPLPGRAFLDCPSAATAFALRFSHSAQIDFLVTDRRGARVGRVALQRAELTSRG